MAYEQGYLDWITQQYGDNAIGANGSVMLDQGDPYSGSGATYSSLDKLYGGYQQQSGFNDYLSQIQQNSIQNFDPTGVRKGENYQYQYMNPESNSWENLYQFQAPGTLHPESGEDLSNNPTHWMYESMVPEAASGYNGPAARPYTWSDDNDFFDSIGSAFEDIANFALGTAGFGVGATTGAAGATGNINSTEDLMNYLQTDLAGLQAASPLAAGTQALADAGIGGVLTGASGAGTGAVGPFGGMDAGAIANADYSNVFGGLPGATTNPISNPGAGITQTPLDSTGGMAGAGGTADPTQIMQNTTGVDGMSGAQNIDLSGLDLDALNQGLEGLGTGIGGISSTLDNLLNMFTNQQGGQQGQQQGPNWMGAGMGLLQYQAMKEYQDQLMQTMNRAIDYSDPFHSQRPQYQQQFSQLTQNPSNFFDDPAIKNIIGKQQDASQARLASQGYNMSGNMAHEVNQTGMNAAFNQYMPYTRMIGEAGGAFQGPGQAGNIAANMGGAAAGAGLGALGALGSSVGSIFGQTPQSTGGTNTSSGGSGGSILNDVLKAGGQIFNGIQGIFS